jgi:hypothetical protein
LEVYSERRAKTDSYLPRLFQEKEMNHRRTLYFEKMSDRLPHDGQAVFGPYESAELKAMRLLPWIVVGTLLLLYYIVEVL